MSLVILIFFCLSSAQDTSFRVITVPVADLRSIPQVLPNTYEEDSYQQTQVLWGECVNVLAPNGSDWLQVEVPDQAYLNGSNFVPYPGYVQTVQTMIPKGNYSCDVRSFNLVANKVEVPIYKRACVPGCLASDILVFVSIGTKLQQANETGPSSDWISIKLPSGEVGWVLKSDINAVVISMTVPQNRVAGIISVAHQLLGWVYFWGGRSAYNPRSVEQLTGLDCSGLTGISYQTNGVILPRDAHGQYIASTHGANVTIKDATLFFFANSNDHVTHVMLNVGNGFLIESTTSNNDNATRLYPIQDRFGAPVEKLQYGMKVGTSTLYWGDFFTSNAKKY